MQFTVEHLISAYNRGFSNGIGIGEPKDRRYMLDADKLKEDALNGIVPGGIPK